MKNSRTRFLVLSSLIGASYFALTFVFSSISFLSTQMRISEALTILPVFTPAAIPGLAIGCAIANISSPFGIMDIILGGTATAVSGALSYLTRNIRFKNLPLISPLFPIVINSILVAFETVFFVDSSCSFKLLITLFFSTAAGEFFSCYILGLPLFIIINKSFKEKNLK